MNLQQRLLGPLRAGTSELLRCVADQPASPWRPACLFVPVVVASVLWNLFAGTTSIWILLGLPAAGFLIWTLLEYVLHSEIFHCARLPRFLQSLAHGHLTHHDDPTNPGLIVARLSFSVPVALVFFAVSSFALRDARLGALLTSGLILGYLAYELVHFAIHRSAWMRRLLKPLASHHLHHHYADPSRCFGVSSPLWDWVFRTGRRSRSESAESSAGSDQYGWRDHPLPQ